MGYDFPGNKMEYWVMKNMFNLGDQDEGGAGMNTSDRGTNIRKVPMKQDGKIRSSWLFIPLGHLIKDWHIPEVGSNQHAGTTQQRANPVLSFKYSSLWKTNFVYHCATHSIKDILVLIRWTLFAHLSVEYWKKLFFSYLSTYFCTISWRIRMANGIWVCIVPNAWPQDVFQ